MRIRRLNEKAEIIIFERTKYIFYANCRLPYYIGGVIENKDDLTLQIRNRLSKLDRTKPIYVVWINKRYSIENKKTNYFT